MHVRSHDNPYADASDQPAEEGAPIVRSESTKATDGEPFEADPKPLEEGGGAGQKPAVVSDTVEQMKSKDSDSLFLCRSTQLGRR